MRRWLTKISLAWVVCFLVATLACAEDVGFLLERAKNLYGIHDYRGALGLFLRVLHEAPGSGEAMDYAGWCRRYLGEWEAAEKQFGEALQALSGEEAKWVLVGLGEVHIGTASYDRALGDFQRALDLASSDEELRVRALKGLSYAFAGLGNEGELDRVFRELAAQDPAAGVSISPDLRGLLASVRVPEPTVLPTEAVTPEPTRETPSPTLSPTGPLASPTEESKVFWGFTLGASMAEVTKVAQERGIALRKGEESIAEEWFYVFQMPGKSPLPKILAERAGEIAFYLCEYRGHLMRVRAVIFCEGCLSPAEAMKKAHEGVAASIREEMGEPAFAESGPLSEESIWRDGDRVFVRLGCNATMQNSYLVQIDYIEPSLFNTFLAGIR